MSKNNINIFKRSNVLLALICATFPMYAGKYYHNSDGMWLLAIPIVILAIWIIKMVITLIVGGTVTLFENFGNILGTLVKGILAVLGVFGYIILFLLKIILLVIGMFIVVGSFMLLFYWICHFFGDVAIGIGLLLGMIIGFWAYSKLAKPIEQAISKLIP